MDNLLFWFVFIFSAITLYRLLSRRAATPKARVAAMLRRYRALERTGLSEQDCLLQILATRKDWKKLPHRFLFAIVSRLRTKEDVMRLVCISEDYAYQRDHFPGIAQKIDLEVAMTEIACVFARFGFGLQAEGRYKEAEFVQKLALKLQPNEYFTNLPLAATYHKTGRHADALPLFEQGLTRLKVNHDSAKSEFSPAKCLAPDAEVTKLRKRYRKMYEACLKATNRKLPSGFSLLMFMELIG